MSTIFQICVEGNTGSTGRIAEEIGVLALNKGWNSYIAYGRFPRPSKSRLIRIGSNWDIFFHGLQTRFFDRHCLGSRRATIRLVNQIQSIKPDIIHLHHLHGYYINIEILFEYLSKAAIPVVWTFHDCWSITGHCTHFDYIGCDKWKTECNQCPQKREYPASLILDRSIENYYLKKRLFTSIKSMTIVPVSNWLENIVHKSFMGNIPIKTIHNGIDLLIFKPQNRMFETREKYSIGSNLFLILGVANPWTMKKGLNDFIELSKHLNADELIVLVGLNENQLKQLPSNIIGLTKTENQLELIDLYSAADLFVNLSVEETFGLTTAEALACGTPAIVYNATACPEIVDVETGIVVDKKDLEGLINAVKSVKKKGKIYYSNACRKRAVERFNKTERLSEYFQLYENMIK